jgi:hypothetical protein
MLFPLLNIRSDFCHILGAHHCLDAHLVIFKLNDSILDIADDESVFRVTVRKDGKEGLGLPEPRDFLQLSIDRELTAGKG